MATKRNDGIERGKKAYKKLTDAWLSLAADVFDLDGDKEALKEFRAVVGKNPAHVKTAVQRFPQAWDADAEHDLFEMLGTIALSKIKDDELAERIYDKWISDVSLDYDDLKQMIADASPKQQPRKANDANGCESFKASVISLVKQCADNLKIDDGFIPNEHRTLKTFYALLGTIPEIDAVMQSDAEAGK